MEFDGNGWFDVRSCYEASRGLMMGICPGKEFRVLRPKKRVAFLVWTQHGEKMNL